MKNADKPAYPITKDHIDGRDYKGLNKREVFAMAAMQGICAGPVNSHQLGARLIAKASIEIADELLKQLES